MSEEKREELIARCDRYLKMAADHEWENYLPEANQIRSVTRLKELLEGGLPFKVYEGSLPRLSLIGIGELVFYLLKPSELEELEGLYK
jgi:hypothetical protein